jgi:ParB-like chromosome segregation protein Spo0J
MKVERFAPDEITVRAALRTLNPDAVAKIAASVAEVGLQNLPTVRWTRDVSGDDELVLVAGRHRLEAVKSLGWTMVECSVVDLDERDARLWEIAENLHRAELTVQERSDHIAEWIKLTEEKARKVAQVGPPSGGAQPKERGIRKAAAELGVSRQEAQRANNIANMAPAAKEAAKQAGLDNNQAALTRVAAEPSAELQLARIRAEQQKAEAHKANRETDRVIALTEAQQFGEWLLARTDAQELPVLISWLEGTKPRDVIAALRREAA